MAGSRDDGTFAEDRAHHPNRKVTRPMKPSDEEQRAWAEARRQTAELQRARAEKLGEPYPPIPPYPVGED